FLELTTHRIARGAAYRASDGAWRRSEGAPRRDLELRGGTLDGPGVHAEAGFRDRRTPIGSGASEPLHTRTLDLDASGNIARARAGLLLRRETTARVSRRCADSGRIRLALRAHPAVAAELRAARTTSTARARTRRPAHAIAFVVDLRHE